MHPDYDPQGMALKRSDDKERGKRDSADFMHQIFLPAVWGMLSMLAVATFVPVVVTALTSNRTIDAVLNRAFALLNHDFTLLLSGQWGQTNLWMLLIAGALAGVFLRHVYGEERVR